MRAISHLFLSRSRYAVFWFLVTCGAIGASGYYVQTVVAEVRTHPQYVMAGLPDFYYLSPDLEVETPTQMHVSQTRLAMETIFHRTPYGLDHQKRLPQLFTEEAIRQIDEGVIRPQAAIFSENHLHQKVEIEEVIVNIQEGRGSATTVATGQLVRAGVIGDSTTNETWSVKIFFTWEANPDVTGLAMFPTVCNSVSFFSMERTFP